MIFYIRLLQPSIKLNTIFIMEVKYDNIIDSLQYKTCNIDYIETILENGFDVNTVFYNDYTLLHWACGLDHTRLVELLLKYKPNLNIRDMNRSTPLQRACRFSR